MKRSLDDEESAHLIEQKEKRRGQEARKSVDGLTFGELCMSCESRANVKDI